MANFASIQNRLEGIINQELNATRHNQGACWNWFNMLRNIMSENRHVNTPRVFGPAQLAAGANVIETNAAQLFGLLVDNSQAAEDLFLAVSNVASTPGTTNTLGYFWVPAATMKSFVITDPLSFAARLELFSVLGTEAGLEAGTASTTQPTVVAVYTE